MLGNEHPFLYLCPLPMEKFELHILGCGSAIPTTRHLPTSQVLNVRDKLFMIDCGEAAQLQFRKSRLHFMRLNHIFISHLHGDHCFGLPGLVSTLSLLGRTADLHIYSPRGLEDVMKPMLDFFNREMSYRLLFHEFDTNRPTLVYDDRSLSVTTIPLNHRMPCCGFLFAEKQGLRHIVREMVDFYRVPVCELNRLKAGTDYVTPEGELVPNARLTRPADPSRKYAYCSDTLFHPAVVEQIRGVDLLFHEATFADSEAKRAKETFHTTAAQAATIARDAGVGQLLIGHFSARYDDEKELLQQAESIFSRVQLARENLHLSILPVQKDAMPVKPSHVSAV